MTQRAQVEIRGDVILLRIEYNRLAIEVLKQTIPADLREYNPQTKIWRISRLMQREVENVLEQFYQIVNDQPIRVWAEALLLGPGLPL